MAIKPLLAAKLDFDRLKLPAYVSPKIDGIRCIVYNGVPMSRTWKQLPNRAFREAVYKYRDELQLLDGEVVVGDPWAPNVYNATMSGIMSEGGTPGFIFLVFDCLGDKHESWEHLPYFTRLERLKKRRLPKWAIVLTQAMAQSWQTIENAEAQYHAAGFEGAIVRSVTAPYKQGRSTVNQGYLLKLKRYEDSEATVIGTQELYHNENPAYIDEQGHTKHSYHKAGQTAGGTLGALICRTAGGVQFNIGTGFDSGTRLALWTQREALVGRTVKYKHLPHGRLVAPRHPVFLGFRAELDMDKKSGDGSSEHD